MSAGGHPTAGWVREEYHTGSKLLAKPVHSSERLAHPVRIILLRALRAPRERVDHDQSWPPLPAMLLQPRREFPTLRMSARLERLDSLAESPGVLDGTQLRLLIADFTREEIAHFALRDLFPNPVVISSTASYGSTN